MARPSSILVSTLLVLLSAVPALRADEEVPEHVPPRVTFEEGVTALDVVLERAQAAHKEVAIDLVASQCDFCRPVDAELLAHPTARRAFVPFLCLRFDVDQALGQAIADRYNVLAYPSLLFLDAAGNEIDRIEAYESSPELLQEVARVARDENTLRSLRAYLADHDIDLEVEVLYLEKLVHADPAAALELLPGILEAAEEASPELRARVLLFAASTWVSDGRHDMAYEAWERVVREAPSSPAAYDAATNAGWIGQEIEPARALSIVGAVLETREDFESRSDLLRVRVGLESEIMARSLDAWAKEAWDDAAALNEIAWRAHLARVRTAEAVTWAERAVLLSARNPSALDTLANLLCELGDLDRAVALETEALRGTRDPARRARLAERLLVFRALRHHRRQADNR